MAIGTPTSIGSGFGAGLSTTIQMTCSAAVAAGQKVIVAVGAVQGGALLTCTLSDSKSNTWATDVTSNANTNFCMTFIGSSEIAAGKALTTSDTITATFSGSGATSRLICAVQVSGLLTASPFDQSAVSSGTATAWTSTATATTTQANELLIGSCCFDAASTATDIPDSPWLELFDFDNGTASELTMIYQIVSATAAYTASGVISLATSLIWHSAIGTYKAAPSSAPLPLPVHLPFMR